MARVTSASAAEIQQLGPRLDVIFQALQDGVTVQDPSGRLIYANQTAAQLIGVDSPEELLNTPPDELMLGFELFDEAHRPVPLSELPGRRALLGEHLPEVTLGFRNRKTGVERWSIVKSAPIVDEHGAVSLAVNVFSDVTERKRVSDERDSLLARERHAREEAESLQQFFSFLAEASRVLASSLDYETTLATVASLAVPHIADWCAIQVVEEDGSVQQLAVAHVDPSKVELARELERRYPFDPNAETGTANVLRTGEPELVQEIPDELLVSLIPDQELLRIMRDLGLRSSMVVPLEARDQVLGAITLVSAESERHFDRADLALAQELASRAALAVDNARLYRRSARTAAEQEAILEHMADGVVLLDPDGRIVYMNRVGRELLGVDEQPTTLAAMIAAGQKRGSDDVPISVEQSALAHALQGETVLNVDRWLRRLDGADAAVRVSATPILAEDGTLLGAVGVFHDVTAEKQLEIEKDAFLSAAAHDLKTPLATIKGLAQVIQRRMRRIEMPDTERLAASMGQIDNAVNRMTRLVNDLLDTNRLEMGQPLELNRAFIDLVPLLHRLVTEIQPTAPRHRIRIESEIPALVGSWDADRLDRVFSNLISNAVKYSPEGGSIDIGVTQEGTGDQEAAVVSVRDSGLGIPAEDLDRIFDRFYRAQNVQARIQGTGIGLASARFIVEAHGGRIAVQSEEGKGATFVVRLPMT